MSENEIFGVRHKFIESANNSKILANKCKKCNHIMLETVLFCEKCFSKDFSLIEFPSVGTVETFTIQAVAPEGFEDVDSYAWVVFQLESAPIKASGFLPGIKTPEDLPLGTRVQVKGFNKHGLILEKYNNQQ